MDTIKVDGRMYPFGPVGPRDCGSGALLFAGTIVGFVLKFPVLRWELRMRWRWTPSIVPSGNDLNFYIVINDYGTDVGLAFAETDVAQADLETTIGDLMSGQYSNPVRVVAFNIAEHWAEDALEDIAREISRRADLAGHKLPSSIEAFVDNHLGPDQQLTLRLA